MRKNQCLFCASRKCCIRIVATEPTYDEVACRKHIRELCDHADNNLLGAMRNHTISSSNLCRSAEQEKGKNEMNCKECKKPVERAIEGELYYK